MACQSLQRLIHGGRGEAVLGQAAGGGGSLGNVISDKLKFAPLPKLSWLWGCRHVCLCRSSGMLHRIIVTERTETGTFWKSISMGKVFSGYQIESFRHSGH